MGRVQFKLTSQKSAKNCGVICKAKGVRRDDRAFLSHLPLNRHLKRFPIHMYFKTSLRCSPSLQSTAELQACTLAKSTMHTLALFVFHSVVALQFRTALELLSTSYVPKTGKLALCLTFLSFSFGKFVVQFIHILYNAQFHFNHSVTQLIVTVASFLPVLWYKTHKENCFMPRSCFNRTLRRSLNQDETELSQNLICSLP